MQLHSHCIVFRCQSHKKMYGNKTEHVQSYGCKTDNELIINKTFTNGVTQIPWKTSKGVVPKVHLKRPFLIEIVAASYLC